MGDVTELDVETKLDMPIEKVLSVDPALLEDVLVLGFTRDEGKLYFGCSNGDIAFNLLLVEKAREFILSKVDC